MRIDSCRNCGQELKISKNCSICREPNLFECRHCSISIDEQYHSTCL